MNSLRDNSFVCVHCPSSNAAITLSYTLLNDETMCPKTEIFTHDDGPTAYVGLTMMSYCTKEEIEGITARLEYAYFNGCLSVLPVWDEPIERSVNELGEIARFGDVLLDERGFIIAYPVKWINKTDLFTDHFKGGDIESLHYGFLTKSVRVAAMND
jgi:hypothetical protein